MREANVYCNYTRNCIRTDDVNVNSSCYKCADVSVRNTSHELILHVQSSMSHFHTFEKSASKKFAYHYLTCPECTVKMCYTTVLLLCIVSINSNGENSADLIKCVFFLQIKSPLDIGPYNFALSLSDGT